MPCPAAGAGVLPGGGTGPDLIGVGFPVTWFGQIPPSGAFAWAVDAAIRLICRTAVMARAIPGR